jgi:drug/metabolite transporter (DMT)-like permease
VTTARSLQLHRRGLLLVAIAATIWSTGGVIVRSLDTDDPWLTIAYRSIFASLFLVGFVAARERRRSVRSFTSMGAPGLVVGACVAIASVALVVALRYTSVANTLVVISTAPLVAAVLARIVLGDPIRPRTWVATSATLVGALIMVGGSVGEGSVGGDAIAALIPVALAVATVTIRRHEQVVMVPAMAAGTVMALLVAIPFVGSWDVSQHDLALLVVFGAGQLGAGLALFAIGARHAPPADVALVSLLEPVLGPVWVWWIIGEAPTPATLVGGTIVLVAMATHTALDLRRRTVPAAA